MSNFLASFLIDVIRNRTAADVDAIIRISIKIYSICSVIANSFFELE